MKRYLIAILLFPLLAFSQTDFEKGESLFAQKKFQQAELFFKNDLKVNPNNAKSLEFLGDIQCQNKNWNAAAGIYEKLTKSNPKNADFQYKYGGALAMFVQQSNKLNALGMIDDIEIAFQKTIKLNPKHIEARWALIEFYLQVPAILGGSERKANRYANELASLSPVDGFLSKGRIAEYFERYQTAERLYKKAIEIGNSKTSYQKLADLYNNKLGQPEKAKAVLSDYEKSKG